MALVLRTLESAQPIPDGPSNLPAIPALDYLEQSAALERQDRSAWQMLSAEQRNLTYEIRDFVRMVTDLLTKRTPDGRPMYSQGEAVQRIASTRSAQFPRLRRHGRGKNNALNLRNYRNWLEKIADPATGKPNWDNLAALAPGYKRGVRELSINRDFVRDVMKLYLNPRQPQLKPCWRNVIRIWINEGHREDELPTYDQMLYYVQSHVNKRVLIKYREGAKAYNDKVKGHIIRRWEVEPGAVFFADHRVADFWVRMPHPDNPDEWIAVRPYVTAIEDIRSRYIVRGLIYADRHPNHEIILECLYNACVANDMRPPQVWYTDQGKDFLKLGVVTPVELKKSKGGFILDREGKPYKYSVMDALRCRHQAARGYNGKEKPVEGSFGDCSNDFDRFREGYTGNCPANRPDFGMTWEGDVMRLPTVGQIQDTFNDWLTNQYNVRDTKSRITQGETPAAVWAARRPLRTPMTQEELQFAFLLPHALCPMVGKTPMGTDGIRFAGWTYSHIELRNYRDQHVMIKTSWGAPKLSYGNKTFPAWIMVFTPDDRLICQAHADRTASGIATTAEEKRELGNLVHAINAAAKFDTVEFTQHTGVQRVVSPKSILNRLPAPDQGGTIQMPAMPEARRRLRAAENPNIIERPADLAAAANFSDMMSEIAGEDRDDQPRNINPAPDIDIDDFGDIIAEGCDDE